MSLDWLRTKNPTEKPSKKPWNKAPSLSLSEAAGRKSSLGLSLPVLFAATSPGASSLFLLLLPLLSVFLCVCAVVYSAAGCPGAPVPGALRRADSLFCFLFFCPPPSERQRSAVRSLLSFSGSATELFCETFLAHFSVYTLFFKP